MDGYVFVAAGNGRLYQSEINTVSSWLSTDYLTKGITQDVTQGLAKVKNQLLMFGRETVEVFTNQGNATGSVLSRVPFSTQRIGLSSVAGADGTLTGKTHYYTTLGNLIFFVGRFGGHATSSSLIAYDGNRFEKVSRTYEDKILSSTECYSVNKITFHGKVGVAIQLTAPTTASQKALVFFPDLNDWFEWESTVFSVVNNGVHYCGTTDPTKVYTFAQANDYYDAGVSFDCIQQFRIPRSNDNWVSMHSFGVVTDTVAASTLSTEFSDDDGATWSTARTIDLSATRKRLYRGGHFRQRLVRLKHSSNTGYRLHRFYIDIDQGKL